MEQLLRFYSCDPLHQLHKQIALCLSKEFNEYGSVSSSHDNSFAWRTFTDASFHFRTGPTSGSFALLVRIASRARSLSLSVNLKSNYTRLRSQAVTQFVVIPDASISATTLKLLEALTALLRINLRRCKQIFGDANFSLYFISSGFYSRIFMCILTNVYLLMLN